MRFPESSGLLLSIVDGFIKDEEMMVQCVDNYHYPFQDFIEQVHMRNAASAYLEDCIHIPRLYIIAGHKDKVYQVEQIWGTKIKQAFSSLMENERILGRIEGKIRKVDRYCLESMCWLYLSELVTIDWVYYPRMVKYPTEDENLVVLAFYWTLSPSINPLDQIGSIISFWLEREQITLRGYQCLTRSFILRNMVGRKVLATFPDRMGNWGMLLEGGIFLPLAADFEEGLSKLNSMHVGQWTIGEVEEILLNPIYAFGYYYQHINLIYEWFYVFLYGLASIDEEELITIDFEILFCCFCEFLGKHICPFILIEQKTIEVDQFIAVLKKTLGNMKEFLKGGEETGVSKNILLMMRNRHAYLPVVYSFIRRNTGLNVNNISANTFDYKYMKEILSQSEEATHSFEKGKKLEELAKYFLDTIPGIRVTDGRSKRGRAEVDIYCCNISYDSLLWRLGALILVECKNRNKKVSVSDIRNLVPTMEAKGITGAMIFSKTGFTSFAMKEIKHQLSGGKIIIPISVQELKETGKEKHAYDLVREKIEYFDKLLEEDINQMYF